MNKNQIINSVYLLPALIGTIKNGPQDHTDRVLYEFGITNPEEYKEIVNLLEYHLEIVSTDFKYNKNLYPLLRDGLNGYYNKYLSNFWQTLSIKDTDFKLLDYGCGDGSYSKSFKKSNPEGIYTLIDKALGTDFITNPNWYKEASIGKYDLILLSEILHCKDFKTRLYLINSSLEMLEKNGRIIINENEDPFMNWRLKELTPYGTVLNEEDIDNIIKGANKPLKLISKHVINYHKIYTYAL